MATAAAPLDEGKAKSVLRQVEFYFSDSNLPSDKFLRETLEQSDDGLVSLASICSFSRMKSHLGLDKAVKQEAVPEEIVLAVAAVLRRSPLLRVSEDGKRIGRATELLEPDEIIEQVDSRTIAASPLPYNVKLEDVKSFFAQHAKGWRGFLTEIAVIGDIHHVNLVKLRGFCADGARLLLVYEYMSRGSLDQCLFHAGAAALEWPDRLGVCVGAARGLAYLHAGCDRKILHCDVKPENILLDDRGGVKIADFGLAKLMSPEQSGLFTTMRGTRGYLAPEWLMNAPITDKADVYSFGMVLLEIVRGRKNSNMDSSQQSDGGGERSSSA